MVEKPVLKNQYMYIFIMEVQKEEQMMREIKLSK